MAATLTPDASMIVPRRWFACLMLGLMASALGAAAASCAPVWLVSNGFHTSLGLRVEDVPFAREIVGDARADKVLIGWGAEDFYRGRVNLWTFSKAAVCSPSLLHLVPVRGAIRDRFAHSDIVRLELSRAALRRLVAEIEHAFARDAAGRLQFRGRSFYADSRYYASLDRFYFPNMCNTWIAAKLRRAGVPICIPLALTAPLLIGQSSRLGCRIAHRHGRADFF